MQPFLTLNPKPETVNDQERRNIVKPLAEAMSRRGQSSESRASGSRITSIR